MVWKCHRCGQKNRDGYRCCMQCQTKKYICPKCGKVDYNVYEGNEATLLDRLKFLLFGSDYGGY